MSAGAGTSGVPAFPTEVVTRALVRYAEVPGLPGELALVTLDNGLDHTRPSTFGPAGLASLDAALDQIAARGPAVVAVALTGKPYVFAVGADLEGIAQIGDRAAAVAVSGLAHRVFGRLRDWPVPTFAFLNGATMGGGLELALHCGYRTVSAAAGAIALPECFLGLVPGWGGTQLLPNLIGADAAVTVIIGHALDNNRMLSAREATRLGIADTVLDAADFLAQSLAWAARVVRGDIVVDRPEVDRGAAWDAALARGRAIADARVHGAAPAPYRALALLEAARAGGGPAGLAAGLAAEVEAGADLVMTDELRASLYAFDLVQKRARRPAGRPDPALARPVTKVGVVGAGLMAGQLALLFAQRLQVPVVLTDLDAGRLERGVGRVHAEIDALRSRGRITGDRARRLTALVSGSTSLSVFHDVDLVIEAVFEDLAVKRRVFADVEAVVGPDCVLATNTSSLSVTEMGRGLTHPERVVGLHFFNPVAVLPLVDVVRGEATDPPTLATACGVATLLKKSAVLVADAPAFVVNRLLTRFLGEVIAAVDEGTPIEVADRALAPLGLPMTPFMLLGLVGPAVAAHVAATLHAAYPDRFGASAGLARLAASGKPGVYTVADGRPVLDPEAAALFAGGDRPSTPDQVRARALSALAVEVRAMLDAGVVAGPQEIDLCLLLGAGWPFHLGGITPYLDRTGIAERVAGARFHPAGAASLPLPPAPPPHPPISGK